MTRRLSWAAALVLASVAFAVSAAPAPAASWDPRCCENQLIHCPFLG